MDYLSFTFITEFILCMETLKYHFTIESNSSLEKQNTHLKFEMEMFCIIQSPRNLLLKILNSCQIFIPCWGMGGSD